MKRAIKAHSLDFAAIIGLLALSIAVSLYILHHERLRFPFIDSKPFSINIDFPTGQAVTPGQGQTVRVAGVRVGDIGAVKLQNGIAVVRMDILQQYKHLIHEDASGLLRPKTGLKDMFIELDPGTTAAPVAPPGYTIPVSQTEPDVNLDEVLASLDADTRQYLELLINSGGQGLKGRGYQLAQVLEKFKPTHQDLARVSEAVAVRRTNLRRLVNSLARLNTALAAKQVQIGQLIDASSVVFHAFAAEDRNVSRAVADLPATLRQTTSTLEKVQSFATILGPAARNLIPAANQLPATNAALVAVARPSTPILRDQIRPFVVQARPLVRNLRPAAVNLAKATPGLTKTFAVFNRLLNMVGFNPGNTEHGYLFWLAWLDHNARTLFSVQDANGDFRPLFLQASCATLAQTVNTTPAQAAIQNLVPILSDANLCPTQAAAIAKNADSPKGALRPNAAVTTRIPKLPTGLPGTLFPNHRG